MLSPIVSPAARAAANFASPAQAHRTPLAPAKCAPHSPQHRPVMLCPAKIQQSQQSPELSALSIAAQARMLSFQAKLCEILVLPPAWSSQIFEMMYLTSNTPYCEIFYFHPLLIEVLYLWTPVISC